MSAERRRQMIAEAAYFRAERRGFEGGDPVQDWVAAEAEVDARLRELEHGALLERLEERLATAGKKLADLRRKIAAMQAEARAEWQEDAEKLASLRDGLEKRLEEIRAQGSLASRKLQEQVERIWDEMTEIIQRMGAARKTSRRK